MKVLITGGMGYIGSHTCVRLIEAGITPIILDNLANSKIAVLERIEQITGLRPDFIKADIRDENAVISALQSTPISAVIHFAGLKAVGESVVQPLDYYDTNVNGTLVLLRAMQKSAVKSLIFSSSATVYGEKNSNPINEQAKTGDTTNPYGRSKYIIEEILKDFQLTVPDWSISILRYFNPVGAHPSGLIGENPRGIPNNLMPYVAQVAVGLRPFVSVFGNDYPTHDGTGVRDYIHVDDLANGHVVALQKLAKSNGLHILNLGTGRGSSVLDLIDAFSTACGNKIPYKISPRRAGDIAICYADPSKSKLILNWQAKKTLLQMAQDSWNWQSQNPNGYPD